MKNMTKLELTQLTKRYGRLTVVDNLDLQLHKGELVTLLGPSGCGKTTTLRMIAGFVEPSDGSIAIDGQTISTAARTVPPERRGMSMIFQSYAIWPNMTVEENVAFGLNVRRVPSEERRRRVAEMLEVVKLDALAGRYPAELSGGQQQRVALARAMIVRPEVLLLDEPLSNLDANLREEMASEIRRLHDEFHYTTVYVTHDQAEAMTISDRIAVINQGKLEQVDTPWNLYNRPRTPFVAGFIGQTNLIEGQLDNGHLHLDGLDGTVPVSGSASSSNRSQRVSIRPHALFLDEAPTAARQIGTVEVITRTYLGEFWDYLVRPVTGGCEIKVHAPPACVFEIGHQSMLFVDPEGVALVG
ncbi:MAG: ABC transporter ATP-binding protein [Burkholderiaceae bacterium]